MSGMSTVLIISIRVCKVEDIYVTFDFVNQGIFNIFEFHLLSYYLVVCK